MSTMTTRSRSMRTRASGRPAYVLPEKADPCRDLRAANDNPQPVTNLVERTAVWMVPLAAFALFALVVISVAIPGTSLAVIFQFALIAPAVSISPCSPLPRLRPCALLARRAFEPARLGNEFLGFLSPAGLVESLGLYVERMCLFRDELRRSPALSITP